MTENSRVLVDSNVLLDIFTKDPKWFSWASNTLGALAETSLLVINPVIYAEISIGFNRIEELENALPSSYFIRESIPWEAAFLAGKCFVSYRKAEGIKTSPLPDFFIGAHALVKGMPLVTRDGRRFQHYFPRLKMISPA